MNPPMNRFILPLVAVVASLVLTAPVSPTRGAGAMKGQMLEPVVRITKAERVK